MPLIFSCNTEKDNYDKLIGYTYSGSELNKKLKKWESSGGQMVGSEMTRSISFYAKDNQRLVISEMKIGNVKKFLKLGSLIFIVVNLNILM
jgi:hypothetical protein